MSFKTVEGGRFRVKSNGTVERLEKNGKYKVPPINEVGSRKKYKVTSYTENGKQEKYYIHHLIADAFLPNIENKKQLIFLDGNQNNLDVSNLKRVTPSERYEHAMNRGDIDTLENAGVQCATCSNLVLRRDQCEECRLKYESMATQLNKKARLKKEWEKYNNQSHLYKPIYRRAILKRWQGKTLDEIGDTEGVTREAIRLRLKFVKKDDDRIYL